MRITDKPLHPPVCQHRNFLMGIQKLVFWKVYFPSSVDCCACHSLLKNVGETHFYWDKVTTDGNGVAYYVHSCPCCSYEDWPCCSGNSRHGRKLPPRNPGEALVVGWWHLPVSAQAPKQDGPLLVAAIVWCNIGVKPVKARVGLTHLSGTPYCNFVCCSTSSFSST